MQSSPLNIHASYFSAANDDCQWATLMKTWSSDLTSCPRSHQCCGILMTHWAGMVEVLAPRRSQQYHYWQLWMLALQPGTVHSSKDTRLQMLLLLLGLMHPEQQSHHLGAWAGNCKNSSGAKNICATKLTVIYWRLEEDLDWSRAQQSFEVFLHFSGSGRDRIYPLGLLASPQTPS